MIRSGLPNAAMPVFMRPVTQTSPAFILTLSCLNRPGIVAAVATHIFNSGGNILEASQYDDLASGRFFMRVVFNFVEQKPSMEAVKGGLALLISRFGMQIGLRERGVNPNVLLMVSKFDHCLSDILYRWRIGELPMNITGIVANHPRETYTHLNFDGIPFHHLPVSATNKAEQEAEVLKLVESTGTDLVVLARYMQVLSNDLAGKLAGRCINIHHSFLPGFKGARPYHAAHARGVKLIGATAHYVTADLDEGPIIEQDVERITHSDSPEDLIRKGRDIERRVLARAIAAHLEGRVIINDGRTVVFRD
jgi:formyltetrahydrofolate deformylase